MTLLLEDLALITAKTLEHYNERADEFWVGTRDHDVTQNIEALLRHIRGAPPLRILDLGCGPGRDLAVFRALGHEPIRPRGLPATRRHGTQARRLRRLGAGFLGAEAAVQPLRRHICQRFAIPRATPRVATRPERIARRAQTRWRALRFEPPGE